MTTRNLWCLCAIGLFCVLTLTGQASAQVGACCACSGLEEDCVETTEMLCNAAGGAFQGEGTTCDAVACVAFEPCQSACNQSSANIGITILTTTPDGEPGVPFLGQCLVPGQVLSFFATVQVSADSGPDVFCDIIAGELSLALPNGDLIEIAGFPGSPTPSIPQIGNGLGFGSEGPFGVFVDGTYVVDPDDAIGGAFSFVLDYADGQVLCDCPDLVGDLITENRRLCQPEIMVEKSAVPSVCEQDDSITYTYEVTNVGVSPNPANPNLIADLTNVILTDDTCPTDAPNTPLTLVSGDTGDDGILEPGETWIYECVAAYTPPLGPDPIVNVATVSANAIAIFPPDLVVDSVPPGSDVDVLYTDTDDATVDIVQAPVCEILPLDPICPSGTATFELIETTGIPLDELTIQWEILSNNATICAGAPTDQPTFCVVADNVCSELIQVRATVSILVNGESCGNDCLGEVLVQDLLPPTLIGCPAPGPITIECNIDDIPAPPLVTCEDNCDPDVDSTLR